MSIKVDDGQTNFSHMDDPRWEDIRSVLDKNKEADGMGRGGLPCVIYAWKVSWIFSTLGAERCISSLPGTRTRNAQVEGERFYQYANEKESSFKR